MQTSELTIANLHIHVVRKNIKNVHIAIYPPDGHVRVSAPTNTPDEAIHAAVIARLGWVRRQIKTHSDAPRETPREIVSGESHYYAGRRYRLQVEPGHGPTCVTVKNKATLLLTTSPRATQTTKTEALNSFYRNELRTIINELLDTWVEKMGVAPVHCRIRSMRTRWGSLSHNTRTITLNLELAKQPRASIEYVLVHELAHLIDRTHSKTFQAVMDKHLPDWRNRRQALNSAPALWRDCPTSPNRHSTWREC